ncbi:phosphatidate cytidylyltransferase [Thiomicrorhabdus sp. ZW0627]|uniref:phosphatidate cytidylyltransferase n=1 Tax=Thiomicrorhabdus sp. ZW0627 TaxID=3039774 RepID=UPI002436926C|nr:phosphatidate cytidylyltransferase [Thiomicrorhabdus sp. ZW0627]MDG6772999.1 phosphatidate cytidylyltransferase [Thiomicrorhabdus sp. ZW0627]
MLKQRVITALILTVLAITALFKSSDTVWQVLILSISFIAAWEWAGLGRIASVLHKVLFSLSTTALAYLGLIFLPSSSIAGLAVIETLILFLVVGRYQRTKGKDGVNSSLLILALGWLCIVLFTIVTIRFREQFSAEILLMSMFIVWSMDTGAYFTGRRFGKTKLAQYVSPGKTWEGVWGGVVLAFIISLIGLYWIQPTLSLPVSLFAAITAVIALISVMGDLFESVLKRQMGVKDSGSILPGHGGILDRIDSLLIALPLFYLLWFLGSVSA